MQWRNLKIGGQGGDGSGLIGLGCGVFLALSGVALVIVALAFARWLTT